MRGIKKAMNDVGVARRDIDIEVGENINGKFIDIKYMDREGRAYVNEIRNSELFAYDCGVNDFGLVYGSARRRNDK